MKKGFRTVEREVKTVKTQRDFDYILQESMVDSVRV